MSIEFKAILASALDDAEASHVVDEIADESGLLIVEKQGRRISLGYPGRQDVAGLPEDIFVEIDESEIYVAFHSGTSG